MKRPTLLTIFVLTAFVSTQTLAQLSKEELKEWKNKAKEYKKNPELLKQLVEDNQALSSQINSLKSERKGFESRISDKDAKLAELQDDLTKLRSDLSASRSEVRNLKSKPASSSGGAMVDGVVFKVQIGAFRNKDLSKYFDNNENFGGDNEDGMQKITLGQFREYWEADTFKKYLREMGVKDAWIVPYRDGVRVEIKDVLEGVVSDAGTADTD